MVLCRVAPLWPSTVSALEKVKDSLGSTQQQVLRLALAGAVADRGRAQALVTVGVAHLAGFAGSRKLEFRAPDYLRAELDWLAREFRMSVQDVAAALLTAVSGLGPLRATMMVGTFWLITREVGAVAEVVERYGRAAGVAQKAMSDWQATMTLPVSPKDVAGLIAHQKGVT